MPNNENSIELSGIFSDGYGINPKKLWKMQLDDHCGHGRGKYVKMVLSYLLSYTGAGNKEAWPAIQTIAEDLECGKDLVIEALQNSEKLKMIRKIRMFPNDPMKKNNKYILDFLDVDNSDLRVRQERLSTSDGATFEVATIDTNNNTINSKRNNNNNSGLPKPPNDYHFLVTVFSELYQARYGTKYIAAKEDHNIFKTLMASGATKDDIQARIKQFINGDLWFAKKGPVSIKTFRSRYNEIPTTVPEAGMNKTIEDFIKGGK